MALNKAHTSIWVKTLIIILIVAFVSLFMYQGFAGILQLFQQSTTSNGGTTVDYVAALNQQNQAILSALKATQASNPTSYTAALSVANAYEDWAQQLQQPQSGASQPTSAALAASQTQWAAAAAAYDAAIKLTKQFDPAAQTDRSLAVLYGTNDATAAITIVKTVTEKAPTFSQAWFNLGYYLELQQNTKAAVVPFQKFLSLNPSKEQSSSISYAKQRLQEAGITAPGGSSTTTTP